MLENKNLFHLWAILIRMSLFLRHQREPFEALSLNQQGVNIPDRNPSSGKSAFNENPARHPVLSRRAANRLRALKAEACARPAALGSAAGLLPAAHAGARQRCPGTRCPAGDGGCTCGSLLPCQLPLRAAGRCGRKGRSQRPDPE